MKKTLAAVCLTLSLSAGTLWAQSALNGLEIGTRIIGVSLLEDTKGTGTDTRDDNFLGSIDQLDVDQNYAPTRLYAQYFFSDYVGAGISYDKVEADAGDSRGSDGMLGIQGAIIYLVGRYPTESGFTPFAEAGVGLYHSSFDENADWEDDGDYKRYMDVDDPTALVLGLGCDYAITATLSVNLYTRLVTNTDMDADHYNSKAPSTPRQSGDFNLDYVGYGIGIKYAFE